MKKIDVGQTLTILANLGVIAGIVFLGYELRQNNAFMAAEARFNRLSVSTENWSLLAENDALAELRYKDIAGMDMTPQERDRWESYLMRVLVTREWSFRELPREELPVETWRRVTLEQTTLRELYERERESFDPEFTAWFDENVLGLE